MIYRSSTWRKLIRILLYWLWGSVIPTPWWADRLTLVWVWRAVPLSTVGGYCEQDGRVKCGFVVRRTSSFLTGPVFHDLQWYRYFTKLPK